MKRILLLRTKILLFTLFGLFASTLVGQTVQIGSGTTTTEFLPIYGNYGFTYSQQIFTAAQIGQAGTIEKIRFYYSSGSTATSLSWTIFIGHTALTTFASTTSWVATSSMTQVFSGNVTYPSAGNWMEITLNTPFVYNGTDNLVIAVDENTSGFATINWRSFTSGSNTGIYYRSDSTNPNPASPPTASSRTATLSQVQLAFQEACPNPSALTVTNITATSADVSWTSPASAPSNGYQWAVTTSATPPGSGTAEAGTSAAATSLTPNTTYYLHVRSDCDGDGFSSWATSASFYTGYCLASSTSQSSWISSFTSTGAVTNMNHTAASGASGGYANLSATKKIGNFIAAGSTAISLTAGGPTCGFAIWVDWNNNLTFETGERVFNTTSYITTTSGSITIPGGTAVGEYRMRVLVDYNNSNPTNACGNILRGEYVDFTFEVTAPPACPPPSALTATSITGTSANLGWTENGTATAWDIQWGATGFTLGTGTVVNNTTNNPYTLSGLTAVTTYQFYVRADCNPSNNDTDVSTWAGPFGFTTGCAMPTPGNTLSTATTVCSSINFTLSLQNATPGSVVTYQWQSSDDMAFTSPTNLGTSATQVTSQTTAKWYRCNVTCSDGPVTVASTPVQVTMDAITNCYCVPTYSSGPGTSDQITNVTLGALNNSSGASSSPYYTFFSAATIPDITQGSSANVAITYGSDGSQWGAVWIDFNQNGIFEASEGVVSSANAGANGTSNLTIAVPVGATPGNTRMRVRGGNDSQLTTSQACGASSSGFGETEDYIVNIVAFVACTGTPEAGTISGSLVRPTCPGAAPSPTTITATGATAVAADITYQWEESTNGGVDWGNVTGGTGATTATYTPPVYAGAPILYRLKVTCTASGLSDVSDVQVSVTNPAAPATQASNISTSSLGLTTATITWTNGNGGRRYVVINTSNSFTDPTGTGDVTVAGTVYSGSGEQIVYDGTGSSVSVTTLSPTTTYYVRVYEYLRCTGTPNTNYYNTTTATNNPGNFTTLTPPNCPGDLGAGTVMIGSLPYSATGQTNCGNGNNVTAANATVCGSSDYYGGEDKTYVFTPDVTGEHIITLTTTSTWTGLMLYEGCPFAGRGGTCVGNTQTSSGNKTLTVTLTSGMTYYLIVDSYPSPSCHTSYSLSIVAPCAGTPEAGTISGTLMRPTCPGVAPGSMTATGFATGPGITYQWEESSNSGGSWANVTGGTGATTTTYTPPVYAGTPILYRLNVTCTASGLSDVSDVEVSVTDPATPATQASNISTSALGLTTATITWTSGSGGRRYVVINTSNSFTDPASTGDVTVAGAAYSGSGEQIVYDGTGSSVSVTGLTQGTTYHVRVYEYLRCTGSPNTNYYNTATATNNPSSFTTPLPPPNDVCGSATPLTCGSTNVAGTTTAGTDNNPGTCGLAGDGTSAGVWYSFIGAGDPVTITVNADPGNADDLADSQVAVYSGACGALVCVGGNDDSTPPGGSGSRVTFNAAVGITYYIYVDGYTTNSGDFLISATCCGGSDAFLQTAAGSYTLDEPCDNATGWTYYSSPGAAGDYMFAIQWGTNTTSKATAVVEVVVDATMTSQLDGSAASYAMRRYWNVTTPTPITTPVSVRFFYAASEKDDVEAAANGSSAGPSNGFSWFKTTSGAYSPGIITATNFENSVLLLTAGAEGFENGIPYVQFDGLTSFSGGTGAAGAGGGFLPVQLLSFTAQATEAGNKLQWATASEENARHFAIERSIDGRSAWQTVGTVAAKGFSQTVQRYDFLDDKPTAKAYYRLRMEDFDGSFEYSNIVYLQRGYKGGDMTIYPVPTDTEVQLGFVVETASTATFTVTDMAGRTVLQLQRQLQSGLQNQSLDVSQLPDGVYLVAVQVNGERFIQRMVKQ